MCYDEDSRSRHGKIVSDPLESEMRKDLLDEARLVMDAIRAYANDRGITDALDHDEIFDIFVEEFQSLY